MCCCGCTRPSVRTPVRISPWGQKRTRPQLRGARPNPRSKRRQQPPRRQLAPQSCEPRISWSVRFGFVPVKSAEEGRQTGRRAAGGGGRGGGKTLSRHRHLSATIPAAARRYTRTEVMLGEGLREEGGRCVDCVDF